MLLVFGLITGLGSLASTGQRTQKLTPIGAIGQGGFEIFSELLRVAEIRLFEKIAVFIL
jgi:hypothetical protein